MTAIDSLCSAQQLSPMDYAYFAQAMQTPTPSSLSFQGNPSSVLDSTATTATDTTAIPLANNPVPQEEPKKSKTGLVLGGIVTVGATALCIAGHKKGPATEKGLKRIWEGVKSMFGKGQKEVATLRTINGKKVVTIPGKKNVMTKGNGLDAIGLTAPETSSLINGGPKTPGLLNEGNELRCFVKEKFQSNENTYKIIWNSNKGYTVILNGKKLDTIDDALKTNIENYIKSVKQGQVVLKDLNNVVIRNTDKETGLVSNFLAKENGNFELTSCVSQYFPLDHIKVRRASYENAAFKNAVEIFKKGKTKEINKLALADGATINLSGLKTDGFEIKKCEVDKDGNVVKLFVTNPKNEEVTLKNNSETFKDIWATLEEDINKKINEKNRKNWENLVYRAAA